VGVEVTAIEEAALVEPALVLSEPHAVKTRAAQAKKPTTATRFLMRDSGEVGRHERNVPPS
jgi:hypothetical protein